MLSESPARDSQRSPSSPHAPWQNGTPSPAKGKRPMYSQRPAGYPQSPQPAGQPEDGSVPTPSLLSRISPSKQPLSARIRSPEDFAHTSSLVDRIAPAPTEEGEIPPDEGEDSPVASGNLQDTSQAQPTSKFVGVRIKTEETIHAIPPPKSAGRAAGRKRGSRSTIDVVSPVLVSHPPSQKCSRWRKFGNPTNPVDSAQDEDSRLPDRLPKRENTLIGSGALLGDTGHASVNQSRIDANVSNPATLSLSTPNQDPPLASSTPALSPSSSFASSSSGGRPTTPTATAADARVTSSILSAPSTSSLRPKASPFPPAVLEQCRILMIPLIDRNAKLRKPGVDEELVKRRALALLSDDKCAEIVSLAREVRKQMQGGHKRHREGSDQPPEPPTKVPRVESEPNTVDAVPVGEDRVPARSSSPLDPGATDNTSMVVDTESHGSGVPLDPTTVGSYSLPQQPHVAQSLPSSPVISPADAGTNPGTAQCPDIMSTETNANAEAPLPSSDDIDLPPATRTARSRTPSEHEPGPVTGSSSSTATSTTSPSSETRIIPCTSPTRTASAATAQVATLPENLSASADTSRHEEVTPHINASPEHDPVAQPSTDLDDDSMDCQSQVLPQEQPPIPCMVPGLWAAVAGRPSPGIEKIEFFVDDATADATRCWAQRQESFRLVYLRILLWRMY
ncbi:hypothetical protein OH76DRAFT_21736 [Lentinus brumalis]|uniref:Uncharacterized protein n=1 Tax=Lentinus brumalis TaxID=2498619 RepID=A0A371DXB6_9APHY|nr:hypothetical protein OH76DRAFT_21736 [Polyporus brumalis]